MEQDAVNDDEADQTPLHHFGPFVPQWPLRLQLDAPLKFALESELLLFRQGAEVWRPFLLDVVFVARKVKGRQCVLMAAKETIDEAEHLD